jgi:uncharacterized membrane protein
MKKLVTLIAAGVLLAGCSDLSQNQKNIGIGTLGGAAGGAALGAIAGNAALGTVIGAGVGALGGVVYNHVKDNEAQSYNNGYAAGQANAHPQTYQAPMYQPPAQ